ncbi:uncharacterized protein LOC133901535 [Phragmites australis]|uniref:uncharacterized protein LOC133901535 n=1 Tax=Phragmites australis TaxID=29695 RepID=UPI002D782266|nr:uncharacterized protein LOC133901535 [Phragmites australis]
MHDTLFRAIELSMKFGSKVFLDLNLPLSLWTSRDETKEVINRAWKEADIIEVSRDELEFLLDHEYYEYKRNSPPQYYLEGQHYSSTTQLEANRTALVEERERLVEINRLLEARVAAACAIHENEQRTIEAEREALEEIRTEAVAEQEEATRLGETSRRWAAEVLTRERLVRAREDAILSRERAVEASQANLARQKDEVEQSRAELLRREEDIAILETDVGITATALDAREELLTRREAEAAEVSAALSAREEWAAMWELELTAREQSLSALAEQVKQKQAEASAPAAVLTSTAEGLSLEERLQILKDELLQCRTDQCEADDPRHL